MTLPPRWLLSTRQAERLKKSQVEIGHNLSSKMFVFQRFLSLTNALSGPIGRQSDFSKRTIANNPKIVLWPSKISSLWISFEIRRISQTVRFRSSPEANDCDNSREQNSLGRAILFHWLIYSLTNANCFPTSNSLKQACTDTATSLLLDFQYRFYCSTKLTRLSD